jgi:tRNA dimethylallyltransferase
MCSHYESCCWGISVYGREYYNDLDENLPSMRSVGYRQALEFLQKGDKTVEKQREMEDKSLFATRQLAKRQYTWLRSLQEAHKFTTYSTITQAQEDLRNCYG